MTSTICWSRFLLVVDNQNCDEDSQQLLLSLVDVAVIYTYA